MALSERRTVSEAFARFCATCLLLVFFLIPARRRRRIATVARARACAAARRAREASEALIRSGGAYIRGASKLLAEQRCAIGAIIKDLIHDLVHEIVEILDDDERPPADARERFEAAQRQWEERRRQHCEGRQREDRQWHSKRQQQQREFEREWARQHAWGHQSRGGGTLGSSRSGEGGVAVEAVETMEAAAAANGGHEETTPLRHRLTHHASLEPRFQPRFQPRFERCSQRLLTIRCLVSVRVRAAPK